MLIKVLFVSLVSSVSSRPAFEFQKTKNGPFDILPGPIWEGTEPTILKFDGVDYFDPPGKRTNDCYGEFNLCIMTFDNLTPMCERYYWGNRQRQWWEWWHPYMWHMWTMKYGAGYYTRQTSSICESQFRNCVTNRDNNYKGEKWGMYGNSVYNNELEPVGPDCKSGHTNFTFSASGFWLNTPSPPTTKKSGWWFWG